MMSCPCVWVQSGPDYESLGRVSFGDEIVTPSAERRKKASFFTFVIATTAGTVKGSPRPMHFLARSKGQGPCQKVQKIFSPPPPKSFELVNAMT